MRKVTLLLLMLSLVRYSFGQLKGDEKTDSLFKVLKSSRQDTTKVNILNAIAFEFRRSNPDTAIYFSSEALVLATKANYKMGIANSYFTKGAVLLNLAEYEAALKNNIDALSIYEELLASENPIARSKILKQKARIYNNTGLISWYKGDYAEALKNHAIALKIREEIGDKEGVGASYNNIGIIYQDQGKYSDALKNHFAALKIREEMGGKQGIADSYSNIGLVYKNQGDYPQALKNYMAALKIREEMGDKQAIAASYNNIGNIYDDMGNYPEASKQHFAALKIREQIGDKKGVADSYNNIGNVYLSLGNYPETLKNYFAALKLREEIGDKRGIADSYNNIGLVDEYQGNYQEALKNHFTSLELKKEMKDNQGISESYNNIGKIYFLQGNYQEALKNHLIALRVREEIGEKQGIADSYINIGNTYTKQGYNSVASLYLNKGLSLGKEIGNPEDIKNAYEGLSKLDSEQGNFKQSLEHFKLYITYRDSLFNEENTKKLVQSQMQYEFDKKESLARVEQEKKDAVSAKELQKQKLLRNGFVGGFAVVLLFAGVFFTQRNRIKKGKKLSDELLLNILPREVAEELKQKGSSEAKQFDDVTVMFTDFKDFTQLSENLSPGELVTQIDYCYKAFDRIMEKYNIEKIKTIGDSYMAAGGLHFRNKSNAADVVKAALEIQKFMEEDGQQKRIQGKEIIEIRIGVHSGVVVAGIVGVKKFAYDIWGDTVNIASRMEKSSEPGKVNISGATYELVKDNFNCSYRGKILAKNKGEIDMYFVEHITNQKLTEVPLLWEA